MLRTGRSQATTAREDHNIAREAMRNLFLTTTTITQRASTSRDIQVTSCMVQRRLKEKGLRSYKLAMGLILIRRHRLARLQFVRDQVTWTVDDWKRVLFTDESPFTLHGRKGRHRVWRRLGTRYQQQNFIRRSNFFGGSRMVWGGIQYDAKTEVYGCGRAALRAETYCEEILLNQVVPFTPFVGENFLLHQDNARPHVARVTRDFLETVGIKTLEWPAFSPDLNPIEHLWDKMGRELWKCNPLVLSLNELGQALEEIWEAIPQEDVWALTESMPWKMEAIIRARGGNTCY